MKEEVMTSENEQEWLDTVDQPEKNKVSLLPKTIIEATTTALEVDVDESYEEGL